MVRTFIYFETFVQFQIKFLNPFLEAPSPTWLPVSSPTTSCPNPPRSTVIRRKQAAHLNTARWLARLPNTSWLSMTRRNCSTFWLRKRRKSSPWQWQKADIIWTATIDWIHQIRLWLTIWRGSRLEMCRRLWVYSCSWWRRGGTTRLLLTSYISVGIFCKTVPNKKNRRI